MRTSFTYSDDERKGDCLRRKQAWMTELVFLSFFDTEGGGRTDGRSAPPTWTSIGSPPIPKGGLSRTSRGSTPVRLPFNPTGPSGAGPCSTRLPPPLSRSRSTYRYLRSRSRCLRGYPSAGRVVDPEMRHHIPGEFRSTRSCPAEEVGVWLGPRKRSCVSHSKHWWTHVQGEGDVLGEIERASWNPARPQTRA